MSLFGQDGRIEQPIHTYSNVELADMIGELDRRATLNAARTKIVRDEWKRRGLTKVKGHDYEVDTVSIASERLDTARLREDLGETVSNYLVTGYSVRFVIRQSYEVAA